MKCPHCTVTVHLQLTNSNIIEAKDGETAKVRWSSDSASCPSCNQAVIFLKSVELRHHNQAGWIPQGALHTRTLAWPKAGQRPCPEHVPNELKRDFLEAVGVLPISPQASAALTRRALQQVLRDYGGTKSKDLYDQIQEVLIADKLPSSLSEQLDAVRVIGNFATHPLKSQNTGLILPVEEHEAEWNLDVLEASFDFFFTRPAQAQARKDALNKKLQEAGKQPI